MIYIIEGTRDNIKLKKLGDLCKNRIAGKKHKNIIFAVPEQFTFETEKALMSLFDGGLFEVEVMSLPRLCHRVLTETGGLVNPIIDTNGQLMVMEKAVRSCREELSVYKKAARERGFAKKVMKVSEGLRLALVEPESLQQLAAERGDNAFGQKLSDLSMLYRSYVDTLSQIAWDEGDMLRAVAGQVSRAEFLRNSALFVFGYDSFHEELLQVLLSAADVVDDLFIALTVDESRPELMPVTAHADRTKKHILSALHGRGREARIWTVGEKEEKPADLTHLEEEFFTDRSEAFGGDVKNLFLTACTTCELEAEEIARKIRQLVKNGVRYRDIGLLVGSVPAYESAVLRAFRRYDIPVFIDRKRSLLQDPLAEFALSALVAVGKKYPAESVLTYMKTGLTGLSADETEKLENYIVAYRVGGHGFTRPFYKGKEDLLTEMEPLRLRLMEPLMTLEKSLRDANTAQALARGLWEFLDRMDFSRRAENLSAMLQEMGYPEEASISSRVHNLMADVLDKMVDIFGDTPLSVLEFSDLFEAGLDGLEVGLIPQRSDEVLFGDTLRTKLLGKDYIFAAGFNEDWVPSNPAEGALLSDEELSELRAGGIDLPFDRAYERAREALSLYNLLTGAEKGLYVSYALSDGAGAVRYPSPYIKKLKNTYPNLEEKVLGLTEPDRAEKLAAFRSKEAAFEELCRRLRQVRNGEEIDPLWWSVYRALLADAEYGAKTKSLGQDLILPNQPKNLSKETMLSLMKRGLTMSISQMEKYRACPYAYFIHYGIRPQVMKEFEVEPVDVGTFLHSVVELFFDAVKEKGLDIATIDDRTIEELVAAAAEEALRRDSSHLLTDSSRNSYIYKKLCRVALKDIRILIDHLKHSDFEPFGQEIDFGGRDGLKAFEVTLQDGSRVKIIGKVDRLDMLRQENRVYVETIDYKSGRKDTDLKEILEGRHLQLMTYMKAISENAGAFDADEVKPAGAFYFTMDARPIEDRKENIDPDSAVRNSMRMRGLALDDARILQKMDRSLVESPESRTMDLSYPEKKKARILTEAEFDAVLNETVEQIKAIGEDITAGRIDIQPYEAGQRSACTYCDYAHVCKDAFGFDDQKRSYPSARSAEELLMDLMNHGMDEGKEGEVDG